MNPEKNAREDLHDNAMPGPGNSLVIYLLWILGLVFLADVLFYEPPPAWTLAIYAGAFLVAILLYPRPPQTTGPTEGHAVSSVTHLTCVLGFIFLADYLFYDHTIGLSAAIYTAALLLAVLLYPRPAASLGTTLLLSLMLLGLLVSMVEYPRPLAAGLAALGLVTLALAGRDGWVSDARAWLLRWLRFGARGWIQWAEEIAEAAKQGQSGLRPRPLRGFLRRWAAPVFLSSGFVVLFAVANPIIESWFVRLQELIPTLFRQYFTLIAEFLQTLVFNRVLLWLLTGIWVAALLRVSTGIMARSDGAKPADTASAKKRVIPASPIVRCLILFNAVFAVQTILDIGFLWGGAQLPEGMSYGTYAHRGAYPLVAVALLSALFVLITFRRNAEADAMRNARRLVYLWLAQNLFLVVSAVWRLSEYIEVYTLTRLRVAAAIWMLLVAIGLVTILLRILARRSNRWLIHANFASLLAVLYICCFPNFDGLIAAYNVRYCREITGEGVSIDLRYLRELGPESIPALQWLAEHTRNQATRARSRELLAELSDKLQIRMADWRGWCYRRQRLLASIETMPPPSMSITFARSDPYERTTWLHNPIGR